MVSLANNSCAKKRVRQGDPLSLLIFVIAIDLLQSMINEAMHNSLIEAPLMHHSCPDYPIIQYADDTLMIMLANEDQLIHLKYLINIFSLSTELFVNYKNHQWFPTTLICNLLLCLQIHLDVRLKVYLSHILDYPLAPPNHLYMILYLLSQKLTKGCLELPDLWTILVG